MKLLKYGFIAFIGWYLYKRWQDSKAKSVANVVGNDLSYLETIRVPDVVTDNVAGFVSGNNFLTDAFEKLKQANEDKVLNPGNISVFDPFGTLKEIPVNEVKPVETLTFSEKNESFIARLINKAKI